MPHLTYKVVESIQAESLAVRCGRWHARESQAGVGPKKRLGIAIAILSSPANGSNRVVVKSQHQDRPGELADRSRHDIHAVAVALSSGRWMDRTDHRCEKTDACCYEG
jgi:hypothetical protein